MLYPLSYEGGPGADRAIQSLTRRHTPSLPTRSQQMVSREAGEDLADRRRGSAPGGTSLRWSEDGHGALRRLPIGALWSASSVPTCD